MYNKIDLHQMSLDAANEKSAFSAALRSISAEIYDYLEAPSERTSDDIRLWQRDFSYLYGSSQWQTANSRLDISSILNLYGKDCGDISLMFFSVQTCFSLLIKLIMHHTLNGTGYTDLRSLISLGPDSSYYCWPLNESENGFDKIVNKLDGLLSNYLTDSADSCCNDNIKRIYESMIPKSLRHALGEYYTPDWLAEETLYEALRLKSVKSPAGLSFADPACGSGSFLVKIISAKKDAGCTCEEILKTVSGYDINPLAVLTAKMNYLLAVSDMPGFSGEINIPVYVQDILKLPDDVACRSDFVIGNPPWVNWEYLPAEYRSSTEDLWIKNGLFSAVGRDLSFAKEDISVLICSVAADKLLKTGGILAFVMHQSIFKSERNGASFRRFRLRDGQGLKVLAVHDLSAFRVFEDAQISTALFFAEKGRDTVYPVPYLLREYRRGSGIRTIPADSDRSEFYARSFTVCQLAVPSSSRDDTSPWLSAEPEALTLMQKVLGSNSYRARTGVFTGGANAVYWLNISDKKGELLEVRNITDRAKRKAENITALIEKNYVYPLVRGGDVHRWSYTYSSYILCPHTAETKLRPVPGHRLEAECPLSYQYLMNFRKELDERQGFAGWEKSIQQQDFYALLRIGEYSFSKYKVVWRYIASEFICSVIGSANDPYLGEKLLLPNEKLMYISTDSRDEAYYLCGLLSSSPVSSCVRAYMNPTSISAHILSKLKIAPFDPTDPQHMRISALCREGHEKSDISTYLNEIDLIVKEIYEQEP